VFPCDIPNFEKSFSFLIRVTSCVPQRSHHGLLLLKIFMNDRPLVLTKSPVLMYADDVKLCQQYYEPAQSLALQSDLNTFQSWCNDNKLKLLVNVSKCKVITFFVLAPT